MNVGGTAVCIVYDAFGNDIDHTGSTHRAEAGAEDPRKFEKSSFELRLCSTRIIGG